MDTESDTSQSFPDTPAAARSQPQFSASRDATAETSRAEAQAAPIVFINHEGKRFVFPFESCRTWETFKVLLEQTYSPTKDRYKRDIEKGAYDLLTIDDEVILPAVWETIIGSHLRSVQKRDTVRYTIKLLFWWQKVSRAQSENSDECSDSNSRAVVISRREYGAGRGRQRSRSNSSICREGSDEDQDIRLRPYPGARSRSRSRSKSRERSEIRERLIERPRESFERKPPRPRSRDRNHRRGSESDEWSPPFTRPEQVRFEEPIKITRVEFQNRYDIDFSDGLSETSSDDDESSENELPTALPAKPVKADPIDTDGNKLLFFVDTTRPAASRKLPGSESEDVNKTVKVSSMNTESLRILKAVQTAAENRMAISVHTLQGPESPINSSSVNIRWHHLHADHLDFAQFKSACLGIQGLSDRLQVLIAKTLERIEKEKLKASLEGMFIDPGTVLRGEEENRPDPLSVIFSCVPYFDIQAPSKASIGKSDRLQHSSRTLMQSYYPYEPVQERDMEQAFRKFKSGQPNQIIHVPSLWIMNITSHVVVTCGHHPLSTDFVKSILLVKEDPKFMEPEKSESNKTGNSPWPTIRVTDKNGRILLYALEECRSYFEMERRIQETGPSPIGCTFNKVQLVLSQQDGDKEVLPETWLDITKSRDVLFIDLLVPNGPKAKELEEMNSNRNQQPLARPSLVEPFFQWPHAEKKVERNENNAGPNSPDAANTHFGFITPEAKRSMHCMEQVEKAMMAETLDDWDVTTNVERSFTSNRYYHSLAENKIEDLRYTFAFLLQKHNIFDASPSNRTMHQTIVGGQCSQLSKSATELVDILYETLKLFVADVDKSTMIRKVWAAMLGMFTIIHEVQKQSTQNLPEGLLHDRTWTVRSTRSVQKGRFVPLPDNDELRSSVKTCADCKRGRIYHDRTDLLDHLRAHLQTDAKAQAPHRPGVKGTTAEPKLEDWIRNDEELRIEETNAGYLAIMTKATDQARMLFVETKQLADGVRGADGTMSEIYTFPHELLKTFRRLVVFYLAIERAIHHTKECLKERARLKDSDARMPRTEIPFSKVGLDVLQRFCEGAQSSILAARRELCYMARSPHPQDAMKRLSLGPEYLCSWFLRRLLVKPIDNNLTVADYYREYITALQFQVNHRPSKRLLRSINLIQEELAALEQVNSWQMKLVKAYYAVLDDSMYQYDIPCRRAMFPYERQVLTACRDNLSDAQEDFAELIRRCGPLSESTKQSAEINEEDHGKAILVFTVVTIIFLPLSFVTSYLGMNTSDIRDMDNKQSLFWEIAIPLTMVTMGTMLFIAYNGEELRGRLSSIYRRATGKPSTKATTRGISVAQRKRASRYPSDSASTLDYLSMADEAEFIAPQLVGDRPILDYVQHDVGIKSLQVKTFSKSYRRPSPPPPPPPPPPPIDIHAERISSRHAIPSFGAARRSTFDDMYVDNYASRATYNGRSRTAPPPPPPPRARHNTTIQPTSLRMSTKYISTETLDYYGIAWEFDSMDPKTVIIHQSLDPHETEILSEHTRRLRGPRSGRRRSNDSAEYRHHHRSRNDEWDGYDNDEWYSAGRDEKKGPSTKPYEWVKKKPGRGRGDRPYPTMGVYEHRGGREIDITVVGDGERERSRRPY